MPFLIILFQHLFEVLLALLLFFLPFVSRL
nr:MAG TPA: hypothetical protein [Caudoviricetes sp.]